MEEVRREETRRSAWATVSAHGGILGVLHVDVHVLPGFLPEKKKKRGVGVGLVSLMQLTSLASSTKRKHASRAWWLSNSGASKPLKRLLLRPVLLEVTIQYLQFDFVEYLMVFCCILEVSKGPYQCFFLQVLSLFLQIEWCCCVLEQFQGSVVFTFHFSAI